MCASFYWDNLVGKDSLLDVDADDRIKLLDCNFFFCSQSIMLGSVRRLKNVAS